VTVWQRRKNNFITSTDTFSFRRESFSIFVFLDILRRVGAWRRTVPLEFGIGDAGVSALARRRLEYFGTCRPGVGGLKLYFCLRQ